MTLLRSAVEICQIACLQRQGFVRMHTIKLCLAQHQMAVEVGRLSSKILSLATVLLMQETCTPR